MMTSYTCPVDVDFVRVVLWNGSERTVQGMVQNIEPVGEAGSLEYDNDKSGSQATLEFNDVFLDVDIIFSRIHSILQL